ncbi:MAG: anthranilate phosphoribosyltransferase, partial [Candidatus Limnocylindrales bacterium]
MPEPVPEAIREALRTVSTGQPLPTQAAEAFMAAVLDGQVTPAQLGGVLVGMHARGETPGELAGFVRAMRSRAYAVEAPVGTIDTCGTGGDVRGTFNISTAVALVVAAAGVPVAKAGNRAVSSRAGSSDVMGALGLTVEQDAAAAEASLRKDGFAYLHAPSFHPGMRHAGPVRMELGVRTAFNMIGPLANPARPRRQLVGVPDPAAAESVAAALYELGSDRAFVVHGERLDELPLDGTGVIHDVSSDGIRTQTVSAADVGLEEAPTDAFAGGTGEENAALIEGILEGRDTGARRDVVALNAGAALVVAGFVDGLRDGVELAARTIATGAAREQLERLRASA